MTRGKSSFPTSTSVRTVGRRLKEGRTEPRTSSGGKGSITGTTDKQIGDKGNEIQKPRLRRRPPPQQKQSVGA